MQIATLPKFSTYNANRRPNQVVVGFYVAVALNDKGKLDQPFKATLLQARSAYDGADPLYVNILCQERTSERTFSGDGRVKGCGYHKTSAALAAAFSSAGIQLSSDLDGRGDDAIHTAIRAVCLALGYDNIHIIEG